MPNAVIERVREKYPQYRDLPDDELTRKLGERYPVYLDQPDFKADFDRVTGVASPATLPPSPTEPVSKPASPDPSKPLLSELYPEMHRVASEWGAQPVTAGSGFNPAESAFLNRMLVDRIKAEAEKRISSGAPGKVLHGASGAIVDIAHSLKDPATLALVGATIAAPGVGGIAGAALQSAVVGTTAGLAAKAVGQAAGSASGGAPLDQLIRESLGAGVMVAGARATAKHVAAPADLATDASAFRALNEKQAGLTKDGKVFTEGGDLTPEYLDLWQQREVIKNRWGGSDPTTLTVEQAKVFDKGREAASITPPPGVETTPPPSPTLLLPDMLPAAESRAAFTRQFGAGNIPGIGRLLDPNARPHTPVHDSLQVYAAERYGVGPAYSSRLGALIKGLEEPFAIDKAGDITNIEVAEGVSRKISDVYEAWQRDPDSVGLDSAQRASFERIASLEEQFKDLEQRHGIGPRVDDEAIAFDDSPIPDADTAPRPYFPRIVTERPKPPPAGTGGSSVGAKAFFERQRMFDTEAEGWSRGYKYETSIEKRIVTRAERLYKRIADKRLAADATLAGQTRAELDAQLKAEYAEELASGEMTPERLVKIAASIEATGRVHQPAFAGRIFPAETASTLNKALQGHGSTLRHNLVRLNNAGKTLFLGFDFGNLFIQMLPTLFKDPAKWATAATQSVKAFTDSKAWSAYARDNATPLQEMASLGSSTGRLSEFMAGFGEGELITSLPVVGPVAKAFGRQFQAGLDVAKTELWKAYREVTPLAEWPDLIRTLEAQLLSGRMEAAGVSPNRALTERAFFLAPSYYRGAIDLIGQVASRGISGSIARRAIGSYLAAGPATYLGIGGALVVRGDMTPEELTARLNPSDPAFLMWKVNIAGKPVNVGFGGIYKSVVKLAASSIRTSIEHPENWASLDPQENPLVRFLRGHSAPAPSIAFDQFTGRDFLGRDVDATDIAPRLLPMAIQAIIGREGEETSPSEAVFSMLGLSSYTEPIRKQRDAAIDRVARARHGKPYESLTLHEQAPLVKEVNADARFARPPATSLQTERAIRAAKDRVARLTSVLTDENHALLDELGLQLRGFENVIRVGGVDVPLTERQRAAYESGIGTAYNDTLARSADRLRELSPDKRQHWLDEHLERARHHARARLLGEKESP